MERREETVTKADLVDRLYGTIGSEVTKENCKSLVDAFMEAVKQELIDGNRIELRSFGVFEIRERKARTARNPQTGEAVEVPARAVPYFRPSDLWRDRVAEAIRVDADREDARQEKRHRASGARGGR